MLLSHALCALAWLRSPIALSQMIRWAEEKPSWSALLHIPPHAYATVAGYEIVDGGIRDLTLPHAFRMVPVEATEAVDVSLLVDDPEAQACPHCAQPATMLYRLEMGTVREPIPRLVPICLQCTGLTKMPPRPAPLRARATCSSTRFRCSAAVRLRGLPTQRAISHNSALCR